MNELKGTNTMNIKTMLDISNYSPNETAYFGDDYVTESNDTDGVAKFIEQYLLEEL